MNEDLAHDAHLRAALRHAPDHALSPPSGLSQTILAAARQAHLPVRPSPAPPPVHMRAAGSRGLDQWLRRLFAPRWAGAWAAGLVATLGLGLWVDLGTQPVLERSGTVAMDHAPPATPASAVAADARDAVTLAQAAPPAAAPTTQQVPAATSGSATPAAAARTAERTSELRKGLDMTQRAAAMRAPVESTVRKEAATAAPPAQGTIVAAAPADSQPAGRVAALRAATAEAPQPAAAPPAPAVAGANEQALATGGPAPRVAATTRAANKAELGDAVAAASPALTLLRRAQGELASGSARWTWATPGAAAMAPLDDAAQAWLSRVVQSAAGRWLEVSERGEALDALEVRWWRDGWPHATLRIEAEGLRWIEPGGRIRYAPLDAAALQRLRTF